MTYFDFTDAISGWVSLDPIDWQGHSSKVIFGYIES